MGKYYPFRQEISMDNGSIFLFIGQFGNQIGMKLVQSLAFNGDVLQRKNSFISVDTEPKVADKMVIKSRNENIVVEKCIVERTGRGANWAMGYNLQSNGKTPVHEIVLRAVRSKVEKFYDNLPGIVMIHSLIGGTGGGLGCRILEGLKEEFPEIHITSVTTAPFVSGESPMQHYNSLLTLAWLQRYADCVFIFHNDEVLNDLARRMNKPTAGQKLAPISFDEINDYICYSIADLFHPFSFGFKEGPPCWKTKMASTDTKTRKADSKVCTINTCATTCLKESTDLIFKNEDFVQKCRITGSTDSDIIYDIRQKTLSRGVGLKEKYSVKADVKAVTGQFAEVEHHGKEIYTKDGLTTIYEDLIVNHHMKFVSSKHRHSRQYTSEYLPLLKSLFLDQPKCDSDGNKYKVSAMLLSARGELAKVIAFNDNEVLNFLRRRTCFRENCNENLTMLSSCLPVAGYSSPLSLSLHVNTSRIADYLEHVLHKSSILYEHSAYIHWFQKFDVTDGYFEEAMCTLTEVVKGYQGF